ncbi:von Willebrand factor A domain-containing protein 1-like [Narcine bancroftii]|uniref:von Willebrand factor A domain-containing protein 1-like n=1 Tax=Narcine bancroftii TaxID=1343680 RepID=UPI0038317256
MGGREHELTYGPVCEPSLERWTTLSWDARGHRLTGLRPDTDYWFRLRVRGRESRELRASARTLPADPNSPPFALVPLSSHRLGLEWSPGEPEGGRFSIVYGPLSGGPIRALQVEGRRETIFLDDLRPQTQYLITVSAARSTGQRRSYTLHGATLPDGRNTTSVAHTASPPSAPITNGSVRSSLLPSFQELLRPSSMQPSYLCTSQVRSP